MDEVPVLPVLSTVLLGAAAVVMLAAGLVWVRRWARSRVDGAEHPGELSPVGGRALGYAAALATGALLVVAAGRRAAAGEDLLFTCLAVGLGLACAQYLLRWSSPRVTTAVAVGAVGMGAVIAAGG